MSYEYTDMDGAPLKINGFRGGRVGKQVYIRAGRDGTYVKPEDAPAVALAILEAAGIKGGDIPNTYLSATWNALDQYVKREERKRTEQAEREAEDAKVKAYRRRVILADDANRTTIWGWKTIAPEEQNMWRRQYRAAREFFAKEETPAPRVLQYGDPEPDHGTKWQDNGSLAVWRWDHLRGGWTWTGNSACAWELIAPGNFPMTEVTGK